MMYKEPASWGYVVVLVSLIIISIIAWTAALMPVYDDVSNDLTAKQINEVSISDTCIVVHHPRAIRDSFCISERNETEILVKRTIEKNLG